ncbi:tetratricopeptide repeat protein [Acidobacteria bacterium AH-259-D05]|nr:tetratricopeptide repeat protein [Acidobacteria bacterium AH-259-D05]
MLAKDADQRYQSIHEVATNLTELRYSLEASPSTVSPHKGIRRGAFPLAILVLVGAAIALVFVGLVLVVPSFQEQLGVDGDPFDKYKLGQELLYRWDRQGNVDRAIAAFEEALEVDQNYAPAYAALAGAYLSKHGSSDDRLWIDRALQAAQLAVDRDEYLADSWIALGRAQTENGSYEEAEQSLQKALKLNPLYAKTHRAIGDLHDTLGQTEEAEKFYKSAINLDPKDWRNLSSLSKLYYQLGRHKEGKTISRKALELTPNNATLLINDGSLSFVLSQYDEAFAAFQKAIEIAPAADLYNNIATILFYQGKYQEAASAFERTVEMRPNQYLLWGNLAEAYDEIPGRTADASNAYSRAIELVREEISRSPKEPFPRANLAFYLASTGDSVGALVELEPLAELNSPNPYDHWRTSQSYEKLGHREEALSSLQEAIRAGYAIEAIDRDPVLIDLRQDIRYHRLVMSLREKGSDE